MSHAQQHINKDREMKKLEEHRQTEPEQLTLVFKLDEEEKESYSNSIELYDFMPKYVWYTVGSDRSEKTKREILPVLSREFMCRGIGYQLVLKPATLKDKDGFFKDFYPSKREELVEDALRKIACDSNGVFLDDQSGVVFSLYQIQKELRTRGHKYDIAQIKDALCILSETHLEISTADGKSVMKFNMIQALGLQTREDWKGSGKKSKAFVIFNPMVTLAIKATRFRRINYATSMMIGNTIARQLYKRMFHHYTQASITAEPYTILLSTVIRDFGLTQYVQLRNNLREVISALDSLIYNEEKDKDSEEKKKKVDVIQSYKVEKIVNPLERNKLIDAKFIIKTSIIFNTEVKKANQITRDNILQDSKIKHHQLEWSSTIHGKKDS